MSSTPTIIQALPIKYGRGDLLQTELQKILGDGNFVVEGVSTPRPDTLSEHILTVTVHEQAMEDKGHKKADFSMNFV
jgi:hypothetical protein